MEQRYQAVLALICDGVPIVEVVGLIESTTTLVHQDHTLADPKTSVESGQFYTPEDVGTVATEMIAISSGARSYGSVLASQISAALSQDLEFLPGYPEGSPGARASAEVKTEFWTSLRRGGMVFKAPPTPQPVHSLIVARVSPSRLSRVGRRHSF